MFRKRIVVVEVEELLKQDQVAALKASLEKQLPKETLVIVPFGARLRIQG